MHFRDLNIPGPVIRSVLVQRLVEQVPQCISVKRVLNEIIATLVLLLLDTVVELDDSKEYYSPHTYQTKCISCLEIDQKLV